MNSSSLWYAVEDATILDRVRVIQTLFLPPYGRYYFYQNLDFPTSFPHCCHESIFIKLYSPIEENPCEIPPQGSYNSKISSPVPQSSFIAQAAQWIKGIFLNKNFWS